MITPPYFSTFAKVDRDHWGEQEAGLRIITARTKLSFWNTRENKLLRTMSKWAENIKLDGWKGKGQNGY